MDIFETAPFSRIRSRYFDEDSFAVFTWALDRHPKMGEVVQGTGGVRKVRWQLPGRGKRGGVRVVYFVADAQRRIYLLTAYAKHEAEDLPSSVLRKMREVIEHG